MPDDLVAVTDVRDFGPGERIAFEPYSHDLFEKAERWMQTWDLFSADQIAQSCYEETVLA